MKRLVKLDVKLWRYKSRRQTEDQSHVSCMMRGSPEVDTNLGTFVPFANLLSLLERVVKNVDWAEGMVKMSELISDRGICKLTEWHLSSFGIGSHVSKVVGKPECVRPQVSVDSAGPSPLGMDQLSSG